ncbi:MAG: hypothetical protein FWF80_05845 [Defluviitaleaceae bacterium]|nr:hypothetical protein [Defluviitaleaceae bacterium]
MPESTLKFHQGIRKPAAASYAESKLREQKPRANRFISPHVVGEFLKYTIGRRLIRIARREGDAVEYEDQDIQAFSAELYGILAGFVGKNQYVAGTDVYPFEGNGSKCKKNTKPHCKNICKHLAKLVCNNCAKRTSCQCLNALICTECEIELQREIQNANVCKCRKTDVCDNCKLALQLKTQSFSNCYFAFTKDGADYFISKNGGTHKHANEQLHFPTTARINKQTEAQRAIDDTVDPFSRHFRDANGKYNFMKSGRTDIRKSIIANSTGDTTPYGLSIVLYMALVSLLRNVSVADFEINLADIATDAPNSAQIVERYKKFYEFMLDEHAKWSELQPKSKAFAKLCSTTILKKGFVDGFFANYPP